MSVRIDRDRCIGCRKCVEVCPGNLLICKNSKAEIRDVRDCWGCTACVKICPRDAIHFYLAADLGGSGGKLFARDSQDTLTWILKLPNGIEKQIVVDKNQSNKY